MKITKHNYSEEYNDWTIEGNFKLPKNIEKMIKQVKSPEDFILEEKVTGSDCPYLKASDFPREVTYELMESYAAYRVMLIENQKKEYIKQISGH